MNDVSVNGVWLSTLNILLVSRDLPPLPDTEENTIKLAGRDGVKNFGSTYAARPLGLGLFIMGDDYYGTVANAWSRSNGVFFILNPGETTFTVTATSPNITVEVIYRYQYLY